MIHLRGDSCPIPPLLHNGRLWPFAIAPARLADPPVVVAQDSKGQTWVGSLRVGGR